MPKRILHFETYSIHGHLDDGVVDYLRLLSVLTAIEGHHSESGTHHVVVGRASLDHGQLFLVIYTGYSEKSTLFFDLNSKEELTESALPGRFPARKTYAMIDANKRLLLIETRRGHLSPQSLALLIEQYAKKVPEFKSLDIVFNPVADIGFTSRIEEFRRIQSATITIARPNVDWTDRHGQLMEVAAESEARNLDVTARSKRGKSLSKDSGLVQFIKDSASSAKTMFQKIKIIGTTGDDSGLITLDLSKHVQHVNVPVDADSESNLPSDPDVRIKLANYLQTTKSENGGT